MPEQSPPENESAGLKGPLSMDDYARWSASQGRTPANGLSQPAGVGNGYGNGYGTGNAYESAAVRTAKPLKGLAAATTSVVGVVTIVEAIEVGAAYDAQARLSDALEFGVPVWNVLTVYDFIALPLMAGLAVAYVLSASFLTRARANSQVLAPGSHHARSAAWVWLGWVIPVVFLWFPLQVVRDVRSSVAPHRTGGLLGLWWGLFLCYLLTTRIATQIAVAPTPTSVTLLGPMEAVNLLAAVAAAACWILLVRQITDDQTRAQA
jgi:hypothetical protein